MQHPYAFGSFRLDLKKQRLMHDDEVISLTPKEFALLKFLIENHGRTVEKDEIIENIWSDTFVEEGTLTRNISWLRKKLAVYTDEKIIETLPKRGYRFLPNIEQNENTLIYKEQTIQHIQIEEIIDIEPNEKNDFADQKLALPAASVKYNFVPLIFTLGALIFVIVAFSGFYIYYSQKQAKVLLAPKIVPFSGLSGRENSPAFSPDGKQLAFAWDGGIENGNLDIYVKIIGAGDPIRLTKGETDEINPTFSPDGKSVAFVRTFPTHNEIILIPALGGAERKLYEQASYASLSFSPDGKFLTHAELDTSKSQAGIYAIDIQTNERIRLTNPPASVVDHTPRFAPDGKSLAFIRHFNSFHREIFIVSASGGEARQITSDDVRIYGLAWNSDSESLFFTSFRETNQLNLWQISVNSKMSPQMISTGSKELSDLAVSIDGKTIAFVEESNDENIWEINLSGESEKKEVISTKKLIFSTRADHSQQFSPDNKKIVFASERTGNYEIWTADADGKNQRQLTEEKGSKGSPRFSPDGKFIAYDAQISGGSDIFIISANGGTPQRLTENAKNNSLPAWSADGKWVFFSSNRSGEEQIWKISASGGEASQITKQGAFEMFAAPDGKTIIYSKGAGKSGLWSVSVDGNEEKPLPEFSEIGAWRSWSVTSNGVFYTAFSQTVPLSIKFYDFASKQTREITKVDKFPLLYYSNLAVSNDGKHILYARKDQTLAGIMFAELAK